MAQRRTTLTPHLLATALLLAACQAQQETTEPQSAVRSVLAVSAGVRIAELPESFEVTANDTERFELAALPPTEGSVVFTLGDTQAGGVNIVETVKAELAAFASLPDGQSFGQTQLVAPIGLTYMARGRYSRDDVSMEELKALVVHPWGNRLLSVEYVYPAGEDTSDRGAQLMELLGEIEALKEPTTEADPEAG